MKRALMFVLLANLILSACAPALTPQPAGQPQPPTAAGAAESSRVAAAEKVTDVCDLMPKDLAARLIPGASPAQSETFPPRCTVSNGNSVLEITIQTGFVSVEPVNGAEFIPGLAEGGYLERPVADDAYLTVILGKDPNGLLFVEVAGHDGKDHKDDAIAVAQEVIARLR